MHVSGEGVKLYVHLKNVTVYMYNDHMTSINISEYTHLVVGRKGLVKSVLFAGMYAQ